MPSTCPDPTRPTALGAQLADLPALDILIHNAGVLVDRVTWTPDGLELTAALHVVRPFHLTRMALPALRRADSPRVIAVSSGGMYTQALRLDWLRAGPVPFDGVRAYANAKRAQLDVTRWWAAQEPDVAFHAMHPGWADTPGVTTSLPRFARMAGPLLRTPEQGADTIVWLASTRPTAAQRTLLVRPGPAHRGDAAGHQDHQSPRSPSWSAGSRRRMPEDLTLDEVASALGVHYMTVYKYVRTGRLPARRLAGRWRVSALDVAAWRAGQTDTGPGVAGAVRRALRGGSGPRSSSTPS